MTELELYSIIQPIVKDITGVPTVIMADPNKPAPQGLYAAIRVFNSVTMRGTVQRRRENGVDPQTVTDINKRVMRTTASIQFYRKGAIEACERLIGCQFRTDVMAVLLKANVGWFGNGPLNNLNFLVSGNIEERAQIDIYLGYTSDNPYTLNSIERVPFSVQDEKADTLVTTTINM